MNRVSALLVSMTLLLAWGCGKQQYESRLNTTLGNLKYLKRLDDNLIAAPTDAKFTEFPMYIRSPKDMPPSREFVMAELPAGQYDLSSSFISQSGGRSLHVLARRKVAKKAPVKNAPAEPPAPRGPFKEDILAQLTGVYGASQALQEPKWQVDTKKANQFDRLIFTSSNGNVVRVYLYKKEPYDAALIWDNPGAQDKDAALQRARDLTLQSFAVGDRAKRALGGNISEGDTGEAPGAGKSAAGPF